MSCLRAGRLLLLRERFEEERKEVMVKMGEHKWIREMDRSLLRWRPWWSRMEAEGKEEEKELEKSKRQWECGRNDRK